MGTRDTGMFKIEDPERTASKVRSVSSAKDTDAAKVKLRDNELELAQHPFVLLPVLHGEVWTSLVAADIAAKLWSNGGTLKFNSKIKPQATWGTAKPEHLIVLTPYDWMFLADSPKGSWENEDFPFLVITFPKYFIFFFDFYYV